MWVAPWVQRCGVEYFPARPAAGRMRLRNPDATTVRNAVLASLAGGVVFGLMMTMIGMVAALVGSQATGVGWLVHLAISALFGLPLAFLGSNLRLHAVSAGVLWGVLAWIGGALVLMPLLLGIPGMVLNLASATPWRSLAGHLVYGFVAGFALLGLPCTSPAPAAASAGD